MYEIEFTKGADKFLDKLPLEIHERIVNSLGRIKIRPHYFAKKLAGSPYYSFRVGDYRLILDIQNKKLIILVLELGHRKKVYKK